MRAFHSTTGASLALTLLLVYSPDLSAQLSGNLVTNGGFETGTFSGWTTAEPADVLVSIAFPHSGDYGAIFVAADKLEFISQPLATAVGQEYTLSFWFSSGPNAGGTPNEFVVKWGDTTILDQSDVVRPVWTNMQFKVTATSANTVLTFGAWDAPDYIMLDDVSVTTGSALDRPAFLSFLKTDGTINFTWAASVGHVYQLQYSADLPGSAWNDLGGRITADSAVMTGSDAIGPGLQRFYRIMLVQ